MATRSEAQQARRAREKQETHASDQAAKAAEAAAARAPDGPVEFEADPNATADAFSRQTDEPREVKRGNPMRTAAYDQIMADRQSRSTDHVHEEVREPQAEEVQPKQPEPKAEVQEAAPEPEMVDVKIDGEVQRIAKSEVDEYGGVRAYQMSKAAEKRLEEAKRYATESGSMFQQLKQLLQAPQKPAEPTPQPEEILRDAVAKIQLGTPEEGQAALAKAFKAMIPQQADTQAAAMQAFMLSQVTAAENAFIAGNKDLVENPLLKQLVISEKERRLNEFKSKNQLPGDWNAFYTSIASDIRQAIGRPPIAPKPDTASQPNSGLAEKSARKADIVALPSAATRAAMPEAEKPLTRDEFLARARKARGQPT